MYKFSDNKIMLKFVFKHYIHYLAKQNHKYTFTMKSETNFSKLRSLYLVLAAISAMMLFVACDNDKTTEPPLPPEPLTEELRPVLTEGKRWVIEETYIRYRDLSTTTTVWDKIVNGGTYAGGNYAKVIRVRYADGHEYGIPEVLREEDGKVYKFWEWKDYKGDGTYRQRELWGLSYDMNPQTDRISIGGFQVESRGTIVLQGKTRRVVKIRRGINYENYDVPYDYWVEGIGQLFGWHPDYRTYSIEHSPDGFYRYVLLECYDGDEKIYDHREFSEYLYVPEVTFTESDR